MHICKCIGEAEEMTGNEEWMKARIAWYWWGPSRWAGSRKN